MSDTTDFAPDAPSEYAKAVILQAALFRGSIITSYAQVEMLLADLVMEVVRIRRGVWHGESPHCSHPRPRIGLP
ncbi:MAG: hypothetical protein EOP21_14220 [Hyphomicrobiales bacterium]|nr:MAG: hypothetical protein EOP21_14220 [Hyphomicrobiales bacterium]